MGSFPETKIDLLSFASYFFAEDKSHNWKMFNE